MISPAIEEIIIRFVNRSATAADLDILTFWIQNPENEKLFQEFVDTHYTILYNLNDSNIDKELQRFLKTLKQRKQDASKTKRLRNLKYLIAACIVGLVATTTFFLYQRTLVTPAQENKVATENLIEIGSDKAILTLEDGSQVSLEKGSSLATKNAKSTGEQLIYAQNSNNDATLQYNYLTIPRGGQFFVKLSDGTKVWLNSESQLKYPVKFIKGKSRQVELVYGEAFFDVSPSTENNGSDFKVFCRNQEVKVLGTEFNVKAYRDETNIFTTLAEGKVTVAYNNNDPKNLIPGEQSHLDLINNAITIKEVDIYNETSWKEGVFSFDEKSLEEIMKVLARWYDMNVVIEGNDLKNRKFAGVLRKNQNIEDILIAIQNFGCFKAYTINEKTVELK